MISTEQSPYLDLQALAGLANMRFSTKHRIEGNYSGRHRSRQQGGGGEFVDYREYSGGEDLRRLDWKVYARTGKAFIRLHQNETNLLCTLAIDASGSMDFGNDAARKGSKLEYVKFLATALSHVIIAGQDQVGLAILGDELREFLPPRGTVTHAVHVQDQIAGMRTTPTTTMAASLRTLFERSKGRGVLLLMSDFLMEDLDELFAAVRLFRHRGWEVVALHVVHPLEERLPEGTAFRFEGMEGEGLLDCSPDEVRTLYQTRMSEHLEVVRKFAMAAGCDYRFISTAVPYARTLSGFLVERAG